MLHRILTINPGATSTKVGLFDGDRCRVETNLRHDFGDLPDLVAQLPSRQTLVRAFLEEHFEHGSRLDAVVGRGGLLAPCAAGTYRVGAAMLEDLREGRRGVHASNLGALMAAEIGAEYGAPAFIVDPVSVDELEPVARVSGLAGIERESICHALNIRAVAHRWASERDVELAAARLVVAHLGTGVSMAAVCEGRLIDVVNPRDEGPFGLDRPGTLPTRALTKLCFAPGATEESIAKQLLGDGGVYSYLGTRDLREVCLRRDGGDQEAALLFEALAYDCAKWIAALAAVLEGHLDAIVLTGGMAHSKDFVDALIRRVGWISAVDVYPGEDELRAMAEGALRVLRDEEKPRSYVRQGSRAMESAP